jgi:hypothetical protein
VVARFGVVIDLGGRRRSSGVVYVQLLDPQQQRNRPDAQPCGQTPQAAIAGIEVPCLDRREFGAGDARGFCERLEAETLLLAQLVDRAPKDAQLALVWFIVVVSRQEKAPKLGTALSERQDSSFLPFPLPSECAKLHPMSRHRKSTPRDPELASLCQALKELIAHAKITQREIADNSGGLDTKQVNSYICGRINPGYTNLRRLCQGIGVKPVALMARIEAIEEGEGGEAGETSPAYKVEGPRQPVSG